MTRSPAGLQMPRSSHSLYSLARTRDAPGTWRTIPRPASSPSPRPANTSRYRLRSDARRRAAVDHPGERPVPERLPPPAPPYFSPRRRALDRFWRRAETLPVAWDHHHATTAEIGTGRQIEIRVRLVASRARAGDGTG